MVSMQLRGALVSAAVLFAGGVSAAPLMIVGNDEKLLWDDEGKPCCRAAGRDSVSIVDLADPENPRIVANLPLKNSVVGPPVNVAIDPSGSVALVADSVDVIKDGEALKQVPDNKVHVIDLKASPPKLAAPLTVGKQPSGLDISPKGNLALVTNRGDNVVSVLAIKGTDVNVIDTVAMGDVVAHVAFTPGRQARAGGEVSRAQGVHARYCRRQGHLQQVRPADRPVALQHRRNARRGSPSLYSSRRWRSTGRSSTRQSLAS